MASPASGNAHQTIITPQTPTSTPSVPLSHRIHALRSIVSHPSELWPSPFGRVLAFSFVGQVKGGGGGVVDIARYERFLGTRRLEWRH